MNKINCIIVDDEIDALNRLENLLKKIDFVNIVSKFDDADVAIEEIIKLKPDLVFLDVEMPKKSGFEVIEEIRENGRNPKFIFVTGYNQYAIKAIRASAFDFLVKPVDIDELKHALNRFYEKYINSELNGILKNIIEKFNLTEREVEVTKYLILGKSSKDIAEKLFISKNTVNTHRRNILKKTKLNSIVELIGTHFKL